MIDADWSAGHVSCLGMVLPGDPIEELNERGQRVLGDTFAILLSAHHDPVEFRLGTRHRDVSWRCEVDTAQPETEPRVYQHLESIKLAARSVLVLRGV